MTITTSIPTLPPVPQDIISNTKNWRDWFTAIARNVLYCTGVKDVSATAGSASALPATPAGYLSIQGQVGGVNQVIKIPYYNN